MYQPRPLIAINRLTGERMQRPEFPESLRYSHYSEYYQAYYRYVSEMKLWDAFIARMPKVESYKRPKLRHATEKGIPVAGLRDGARRKYVNGSGVSANSRILPHRYADEGEKGKGHRREIRRKEETLWRAEAVQEMEEYQDYEGGWSLYEYDACDEYDWTDYDRLTDPREYSWDGYEWDEDEYECNYCMGPCEL